MGKGEMPVGSYHGGLAERAQGRQVFAHHEEQSPGRDGEDLRLCVAHHSVRSYDAARDAGTHSSARSGCHTSPAALLHHPSTACCRVRKSRFLLVAGRDVVTRPQSRDFHAPARAVRLWINLVPTDGNQLDHP